MTEDTASKAKGTNPIVTLPVSKAKVEMRIALGSDEASVTAKFPIKPGDTESYILNRRAMLCSCIISLDGKAGPATIDQLNALSLRDRSKLELMYNAMNEATEADDKDIKELLNPFFGE